MEHSLDEIASTPYSTGLVAPGFEKVRSAFDAMLLDDDAYSAQLAITWKGATVVDLVGGPGLRADSITGVFSSSKGVAATAFATLVDSDAVDLDQTAAHYWPEFAVEGKGAVTVRQLLSHQVGLLNVPGGFSADDLIDSRDAAARLASMIPLWQPGRAFGYHGITVGIFLEELTRRVLGTTLQDVYEREVRAPRGIDFYLGLPDDQGHRWVDTQPPQMSAAQLADAETNAPPEDGYAALMINRLPSRGDPFVELSPNVRALRAAGPAAATGAGSARGLAAVYQAALGYNGPPLFSARTRERMAQLQCAGLDLVLRREAAFAVVFAKPAPGADFASHAGFGHDGAGGALGFADPAYDIAFGYVPHPMQYPGGTDSKALVLSRIARACVLTAVDTASVSSASPEAAIGVV